MTSRCRPNLLFTVVYSMNSSSLRLLRSILNPQFSLIFQNSRLSHKVFQQSTTSKLQTNRILNSLKPPAAAQKATLNIMSERTVSRAQLYDNSSDDNFTNHPQSDSSNGDADADVNEYTMMPPPGFDFEIVDVEDEPQEAEESSATENSRAEEKDQNGAMSSAEDEEHVEYFPLFSTTAGSSSDAAAPRLVRLKIDDNADVDVESVKFDDSDYDKLVEQHNARARRQRESGITKIVKIPETYDYAQMINEMAVDGNTIREWSVKFAVPSTRKLIDLKEYNAKIELYHKIEKAKKDAKRKSRPGKKQREAKMWKKLREKEWKQKLREAQRKAKLERDGKFDRYDDYKTESSKKFKFSDSFKKRPSTSKSPSTSTSTSASASKSSSTTTRNKPLGSRPAVSTRATAAKPKAKFRTE
jgi:hypothetical protein